MAAVAHRNLYLPDHYCLRHRSRPDEGKLPRIMWDNHRVCHPRCVCNCMKYVHVLYDAREDVHVRVCVCECVFMFAWMLWMRTRPCSYVLYLRGWTTRVGSVREWHTPVELLYLDNARRRHSWEDFKTDPTRSFTHTPVTTGACFYTQNANISFGMRWTGSNSFFPHKSWLIYTPEALVRCVVSWIWNTLNTRESTRNSRGGFGGGYGYGVTTLECQKCAACFGGSPERLLHQTRCSPRPAA